MSTLTAAGLWEKATGHLRGVLHSDVYQRWIAVIEPVDFSSDTLTLGVDNDFYQTWLEEHYLALIRDAVTVAGGMSPRIVFTVRKSSPERPAVSEPPRTPSPGARAARPAAGPLNAKFTFDDFIVGSCNNFAHAASLAVAQAPGRAYNPFFIYGGTGLGKTHLMQAIGQYVLKNSRAVVSYVSSEAFVNEYITALQSRGLVSFRKKYRSVDLLLIDDIHFLGGKDRLQEEFFHTFNTLFDSHKQIVMTSDRPASEISALQQRLVSRFEWGLVTEMEAPDLETRIAILRHKLSQMQTTLSDDTLLFIAENIRSNIRRLEGALTRVVSYASLTKHALTIEALERLLHDTLCEERIEALTFSAIQKAVAEHFDVRLADMTSRRRPQSIAVPRQVAMYLCRRLTDASFPEIAAAFEKTHATVLHACRRMDSRCSSDETFRRSVHAISKNLGRSL